MRRVALFPFLLLLCSACAFTDIPLTLPTKGLERTIPGGNGRQVIVVIPLSDAREIRDRCMVPEIAFQPEGLDPADLAEGDELIVEARPRRGRAFSPGCQPRGHRSRSGLGVGRGLRNVALPMVVQVRRIVLLGVRQEVVA